MGGSSSHGPSLTVALIFRGTISLAGGGLAAFFISGTATHAPYRTLNPHPSSQRCLLMH